MTSTKVWYQDIVLWHFRWELFVT